MVNRQVSVSQNEDDGNIEIKKTHFFKNICYYLDSHADRKIVLNLNTNAPLL